MPMISDTVGIFSIPGGEEVNMCIYREGSKFMVSSVAGRLTFENRNYRNGSFPKTSQLERRTIVGRATRWC